MRSGKFAGAVVMCALGLCAPGVRADYSHDFNSDTVVTSGPRPGFTQFNGAETGNSGWQVQGGQGGGAALFTAGIDNNGVGGSRALFGTLDSSAATSFVFWQLQFFGIGAQPAGTTSSQLQVSYDMRADGADSATPWTFEAGQGANFATYHATFAPTLTNGAYAHESFLLSGVTQTGAYDPTQALTIQFSSGANGFDASNAVHLDNFSLTIVPEPGSVMGLLAIGGLLRVRRRA